MKRAVLLFMSVMVVGGITAGCSSTTPQKNGGAGSGATAGTTGAAGATAGTTGTAGAVAGTTGAGGVAGGTTGTAGAAAGTAGTAGATAGTTGGAGAAAGTTGAAGAAGGTTGAAGASGGAAGAPPTCSEIPSLASGSTTFKIMSSEFASCAPIPAASTCDAKPFPQGTSPALSWTAGPTGTMSYALVFKDLSVLARTASTEANYNRGFHYVMWDIPASVTSLPANIMGGFMSPTVTGALQWSNFNNYGFFGPCPNFDPAMPTSFNDVYTFELYALPVAKVTIPAPMTGISTVRLMDDVFKPMALAIAEYRGTSSAHSSEIPAGTLPPTAKPPCGTGNPAADTCLTTP